MKLLSLENNTVNDYSSASATLCCRCIRVRAHCPRPSSCQTPSSSKSDVILDTDIVFFLDPLRLMIHSICHFYSARSTLTKRLHLHTGTKSAASRPAYNQLGACTLGEVWKSKIQYYRYFVTLYVLNQA